jgi:hypothetical protein
MKKVTIKLQTDDGQKIKIDCAKDAEELRDKLLEHGLDVTQMTPVMSMVNHGRQLLEV